VSISTDAERAKAKPANARDFDGSHQALLGQLRTFVDELALTEQVVNALLPNGRPHDFESALWDYKETVPSLPDAPTEEHQRQYKADVGDIIKDVVSFHNCYGGYIVFGVADKGKERLRGCNIELDCTDLNRRLESYTGANIECLYRIVPAAGDPSRGTVGVLLIPRRAAGYTPVRFVKKGPDKRNGTRCFNDETYIRVRDECRPATATSADWQLLHSDRNPPEKEIRSTRPAVKVELPARDSDLIKFVGRETPLAALRTWLTDLRSPIRLITGIGGLGKTTLAYHFAEEVAQTGAGDVEWIIWLTAKERTFSALRGQLVAASKVDFSDLQSLYGAILKSLSHEMAPEEEEPTLDQIADRVVEALTSYSCLIIVDDIDSLTPDQQKETVAALNAVALRTVGREIAPSRILMTSRIDQGMPPTAVIKISGFERDEFAIHLANLCQTFRIKEIKGRDIDGLFEATSGSPLFAASIIRLLSLGENLKDVVETWRGQEGEDVRKFAFEREIQRLNTVQSRLLYAVLMLGETSVNDLASVLDVTPKVVRDRISELQAYHLLSITTKLTGDATIFAPSDLLAVTGILKAYLGSNARAVESACARAQERSSTDSREIGAGIRKVVAAWNMGNVDAALLLAQELRKRFQKSGDIANVLGQAFLKASPPRWSDADREFEAARRLGCSRSELVMDSIGTKTELQDWQGLYELTRHLTSNNPSRDMPLTAFLRACAELVSVAKARGDHARAAELSIEAVEKIMAKTLRQRLEQPFFNSLASMRFEFAREYVNALEHLNPHAGDKLRVFDGVARLTDAGVILYPVVKAGVSALRSWWGDVENRPVVDRTACGILIRQLNRLENIERQLANEKVSNAHITVISNARRDLAFRGAKLSA
jgi:hypothetical protein